MSIPNDPNDFLNDDEEPEIWDEHQWEEFMKKADKRTDRYSELLEKYMGHPDRDKIIAKEMGWDWLAERLEEDDTDEFSEESNWADNFIHELEEGEEWKQAAGYQSFEPDIFDEIESLPVYRQAYEYTIAAFELLETHLDGKSDESINAFASSVGVPSAKIAGGYGMGFDMHGLGGNIANCKRGLKAANKSLIALQKMRKKGLIDQETFLDFYERGKEVRDNLGIYIVELREKFRRGID